ncbi:MAG TPA: kelch repeat-containing protein, partial [Vulgatibacter sp.]
IGGFTRTRDGSGSCSSLAAPRAGHTATLLQDGRVLLAGGFRVLASGAETDVTDTAEIFDPLTGAFSSAGKMCAGSDCMPRAHGQAALLRDGRVLIVGGIDGSGNPTASAIVYDPAKNAWAAAGSMQNPRRGHSATLLGARADGPVIVVGGVDEAGTVVAAVEVFDPKTNEFGLAKTSADKPVHLPRAYHRAVNVGGKLQAIEVAGGIDDMGDLVTSIDDLLWDQGSGSFTVSTANVSLGTGVVGAGLAAFQNQLATVGGASKWTPEGAAGIGKSADPIKTIQWFDKPGAANASGTIEGQLSRIDPCVAMLDTERALVLGGFTANGLALSKAEVIGWQDAPDPQDGSKTIKVLKSGYTENLGKLRDDGGRGWATCTDLGEGRVLVAGGIGQNGTSVRTAEIFVVAPLSK